MKINININTPTQDIVDINVNACGDPVAALMDDYVKLSLADYQRRFGFRGASSRLWVIEAAMDNCEPSGQPCVLDVDADVMDGYACHVSGAYITGSDVQFNNYLREYFPRPGFRGPYCDHAVIVDAMDNCQPFDWLND